MKENILKWMGGKHALAPFIIEKMPPHNGYVEVFGGALHVFFQKPISKRMNVVNDLNSNLVNMYKVINDPLEFERLNHYLDHVLYDRNMFNYLQKIYRSGGDIWRQMSVAERAFAFIYLNRTSFNGKAVDYAKRVDAGILYDLRGIILQVFKKLQAANVVIENLHFSKLLKESKNHFDKDDVLIYLDPPYWVTTDSKGSDYYEFKMNKSEHEELRDVLGNYKNAHWLMSYDDVPHVRELYKGYSTILTPAMNQSSGNAIAGQLDQEAVYKSEILIGNYNLETEGTLFG